MIEKQRKIFLSYSRTNKDFAIQLSRELKAEGFNIWLDQLDIPAGARWDREVERALRESEIFMIILTPASVDSENVLDEIGYAIDNKKRFLPVLLENCDVPLRLRRFQYVDFTNKSFDEGVQSAKELLKGLVAQPITPRTTASGSSVQAEADRKTKDDREAKTEADRLVVQKAEAERIAKEKAEIDRRIKEEAERLFAQKAEEERLAKSKSEAERKAKADARRKAKEEKAAADRIAAQRAEEQRVAKQKADEQIAAKTKAEADRLAAQKAEEERAAKQKAEEERLVIQRAEEERIAKAKVEAERKAEADRLAAQQAQTERLAKQKLQEELAAKNRAEKQRKDKEEADRLAAQKAEAERQAKVVIPTPQRRSASRGMVIGVVAVGAVLMMFAVAAYGLSRLMSPTATAEPQTGGSATDVPEEQLPETSTATAPPPATTRRGGWLDQLNFSVISSEAAVDQLQTGTIDIYGTSLLSSDYSAINDAGLNYSASFGLFYDILYNPAVFNRTNTINPFSNRKIREATNWLYDREYINQEVYGNASLPRYFPITTNGLEYAALADTVQALEAKYAYNPEEAKQIISDEMIAMGAELDAGGKWQYQGRPVTLIFLIRNDSDGTRVPLGDYVANQLESVGFTVDRQYKRASEASPIWLSSDPKEGQWHLYTAAWSNTFLDRDESRVFQDMYLPLSIQGYSFLDANSPSPDFEQIGNDLADKNFTTLAQRHQMMEQALEFSLQDSLQVWLIDHLLYTPYKANVQVASDLERGIEGTQAWPFTIRYAGEEGGSLNWASEDLFSDPWNPVAGSSWTWDQGVIYAIQSDGLMADPTTGLAWPLRIERAEVTVQSDLVTQTTHDWVTLENAGSINVPSDAWVDWDADSQTFITAGSGKTAKVKSVVYYPADLFETVKWHDGSPLSVGDFVMSMIMMFDPAKTGSAIYDDINATQFDTFMATFKGMRMVSTDPLIVEYYTDSVYLDAEWNVYSMWPLYGYGYFGSGRYEAGWHAIAMANMAESSGELAYSIDKADSTGREWMNFLSGPSLDVLSAQLDILASENFIPYAPTMGQFVTAEEASTRYSNLRAWYAAHNHFWVGTGPYYLDTLSFEDKTLTLKHYPDYPDLADRWMFLVK